MSNQCLFVAHCIQKNPNKNKDNTRVVSVAASQRESFRMIQGLGSNCVEFVCSPCVWVGLSRMSNGWTKECMVLRKKQHLFTTVDLQRCDVRGVSFRNRSLALTGMLQDYFRYTAVSSNSQNFCPPHLISTTTTSSNIKSDQRHIQMCFTPIKDSVMLKFWVQQQKKLGLSVLYVIY